MTPDDLAAIRAACDGAWLENAGEIDMDDILALTDALEQARASIREMAADALSREAQYDEMYERAERAEARVFELEAAANASPDSLRAALVAIKRGNDHLQKRAERAEAVLARLRALCKPAHWTLARQAEIRAAIDGDTQ